jgi:hypothetical protein
MGEGVKECSGETKKVFFFGPMALSPKMRRKKVKEK